MKFEFDKSKSVANKKKHGIDFVDAQLLWDDDDAVMFPVIHTGEPRYMVLGKVWGKHWTAIITLRGEYTRLISIRRSRKREMEVYEEKANT